MPDAPPGPIESFRQAVLGDEGLQERIGDKLGLDTFLDRCAEAAAARGLPLDRATIAGALEPAAHSPMLLPPPPTLAAPPPRRWLPSEILPGAGAPLVEWLYFGEAPLTEPFFAGSVLRARSRPINRLLRLATPVGALAELAAGPVPDGFVFHMSRCGSTLVSRMLAALPGAVSLSEPAPLDGALRLAVEGQVPPEAVRGMIAALGRERGDPVRYRFVKFNCWHTLALPLLRELFPQTPWLFLFRDPVEVLASHAKAPSFETMPGAVPSHALREHANVPADEYLAWMLGRVCRVALDALSGGGLAVDYRALPAALERAILPHFGIEPGQGTAHALATVAGADAKDPRRRFATDSAARQVDADAALRELADRHLGEAFRQLEALAGPASS